MTIISFPLLKNNSEKEYFHQLYDEYGCIPISHMNIINKRIEYMDKFLLKRNLSTLNTIVERDLCFSFRKRFYWEISLRSFNLSILSATLICGYNTFIHKKIFIWPFFPLLLGMFYINQKLLFIYNNKSLFEMCKLSKDYEIGKEWTNTNEICEEMWKSIKK